jgi:hypothetical protein
MMYYQAIDDPRGTLIIRYFMNEDPDMRAQALEEIRSVMGALVSDYRLILFLRLILSILLTT